MFGIAPGATNRASLQTNKNGRHAGEVTLALQGLEHLVNRVLHNHLCLGSKRALSQI
jgi:hypothetical protein